MTLSETIRDNWAQLVAFAADSRNGDAQVTIAASEGAVSRYSLAHKVKAIRFFLAKGKTPDEVCALGQRYTVSSYNYHRGSQRGPLAQVLFKVPPDQKVAIEQMMERIGSVTGEMTSEGRWDFILSTFREASDSELRHQAGMEPDRRRK